MVSRADSRIFGLIAFFHLKPLFFVCSYVLPLSGQRKLCFGETAYSACSAERCHGRFLLLVDGADIQSDAVDNGSRKEEKFSLDG